MTSPTTTSFADHLAAAELIPARELERVARLRQESGESWTLLLTRLGLISEAELARAQAVFFKLPLLSAEQLIARPLDPGNLSPTCVARAFLGCD
jgi:general secretion pathway protein E